MVKYEYSLVDLKYVKENPEEYIIPDCLEACKILWDKGIRTAQCSNLEDLDSRWIEIDTVGLSQENSTILYNNINAHVEGFYIGGMTHNPRISVNGTGEEASKRLCELANMLSLQDTCDFVSSDDYLDSYKRTDGEYIVLPTGVIQRDYNPLYSIATIADALNANDAWDLYVEEEGRVYDSAEALQAHIDYLNKKSNSNQL